MRGIGAEVKSVLATCLYAGCFTVRKHCHGDWLENKDVTLLNGSSNMVNNHYHQRDDVIVRGVKLSSCMWLILKMFGAFGAWRWCVSRGGSKTAL